MPGWSSVSRFSIYSFFVTWGISFESMKCKSPWRDHFIQREFARGFCWNGCPSWSDWPSHDGIWPWKTSPHGGFDIPSCAVAPHIDGAGKLNWQTFSPCVGRSRIPRNVETVGKSLFHAYVCRMHSTSAARLIRTALHHCRPAFRIMGCICWSDDTFSSPWYLIIYIYELYISNYIFSWIISDYVCCFLLFSL